MIPCKMSIVVESFPLIEPFVISRGARTEAIVVEVQLVASDGKAVGKGECTPYPRYGESVESVIAQIEAVRPIIEAGVSRSELASAMPSGAARNAVDCALWDLEAKHSGIRAHVTAGINPWPTTTTAFTISLGTPEVMAASAAKAADRPLLKIKLGGADGRDIERARAVRSAAPKAMLIADANEGWTEADIEANLAACAEAGFSMIEQPLPAKADGYLSRIGRPVPICADESVHDRETLSRLKGLYDLINIKLDKTGGLTEGLAVATEAERLGLDIMVGCMLGSSLAMAPGMILAGRAKFVDLDAPLLLASDRTPPMRYDNSIVFPPPPELWG